MYPGKWKRLGEQHRCAMFNGNPPSTQNTTNPHSESSRFVIDNFTAHISTGV